MGVNSTQYTCTECERRKGEFQRGKSNLSSLEKRNWMVGSQTSIICYNQPSTKHTKTHHNRKSYMDTHFCLLNNPLSLQTVTPFGKLAPFWKFSLCYLPLHLAYMGADVFLTESNTHGYLGGAMPIKLLPQTFNFKRKKIQFLLSWDD